MTEHTKTDGLPGMDLPALPAGACERSPPRNERMAPTRSSATPARCCARSATGKTGACDRYANRERRAGARRSGGAAAPRRWRATTPALVPFAARRRPSRRPTAPTPAGAATCCTPTRCSSPASARPPPIPTTSPRPSSSPRRHDGVDMVTVVTEGIFSYCSFKVKIDTDRCLGPEQANVRCKGEVVGHVTTAEYGSQMLSLGGVHHLTGGSKKEGRITVRDDAGARQQAGRSSCTIDGGAQVRRSRPAARRSSTASRSSACAWAAARPRSASSRSSCYGQADEVVVVDDHITGVLTEHQAGRCLDMRAVGHQDARPQVDAGALLPGRQPGHRLGRHRHRRSAVHHRRLGSRGRAWPGLRLLMVSTTGEHAAWYVLDEQLRAASSSRCRPRCARVVERIGENCEPSLTTVLFLGGAGGSLRAGVTENPVLLTRSIKQRAGQRDLRRRAGLRVAGRRHHRDGRRDAHARQQLRHGADAGDRGADRVQHAARRLPRARRPHGARAAARARCWRAAPGTTTARRPARRWRARSSARIPGRSGSRRCWADRPIACAPQRARASSDGRWHFQHGPIDIVIGADGEPARSRAAHERRMAALRDACSTSWSRELPLLRLPVERRRCPLQGASRGACGAACRAVSRRLHHADGGGGRRGGAGADRAATTRPASRAPGSTTAATSRCTWRRASRCASACSPTWRGFDRAAAARIATDGHFEITHEHAGARHRHQRLARPQLLARHRRQRDGAGAHRGRRPMPRPR